VKRIGNSLRSDLSIGGMLLGALALLLLGGLSLGVDAEAGDLKLRHGDSLVIDGSAQEPLWSDALRVPVPDAVVPTPEGLEKASVDLRVTTADGRLCVAFGVAEAPGTAMGAHLMIARADANTAAQAVSIDFRPMDPRAPRLDVRGPRGVGRKFYRVEGAVVSSETEEWTGELAVPLADLVGEDRKAPLRVAIVIYTRTPNRIVSWPADALWSDPSKWALLEPEAGAWTTDVAVNAERLAREDAADAKRAFAWIEYLKGTSVSVDPMQPREKVEAHLRLALFEPLGRILEHRPDLAVPVRCLRGDIHLRLGNWKAAAEDFGAALAQAPGWREAAYGLYVKMARQPLAPVGEATDYALAAQRIAAIDVVGEKPAYFFSRHGVTLRTGLLEYFRGNFERAVSLLEMLPSHYPHDAYIKNHLGFAKKAQGRAGFEKRKRAQDEKRKLPRAILATTQGKVVLELYQDDAPNTVNNFVYLGRKKFYDGVAIHRTVPFFVVQTGDGLTKSKDEKDLARVGTGTAGYAIRSEVSDRALLRGVVAMANTGKNTESAQFFITTGTAVHLEGDQTVFGRVLEGQDVVEKLTEQDRIEGITFERLDPERAYHPTDASGRSAPDPEAR